MPLLLPARLTSTIVKDADDPLHAATLHWAAPLPVKAPGAPRHPRPGVMLVEHDGTLWRSAMAPTHALVKGGRKWFQAWRADGVETNGARRRPAPARLLGAWRGVGFRNSAAADAYRDANIARAIYAKQHAQRRGRDAGVVSGEGDDDDTDDTDQDSSTWCPDDDEDADDDEDDTDDGADDVPDDAKPVPKRASSPQFGDDDDADTLHTRASCCVTWQSGTAVRCATRSRLAFHADGRGCIGFCSGRCPSTTATEPPTAPRTSSSMPWRRPSVRIRRTRLR